MLFTLVITNMELVANIYHKTVIKQCMCFIYIYHKPHSLRNFNEAMENNKASAKIDKL